MGIHIPEMVAIGCYLAMTLLKDCTARVASTERVEKRLLVCVENRQCSCNFWETDRGRYRALRVACYVLDNSV